MVYSLGQEILTDCPLKKLKLHKFEENVLKDCSISLRTTTKSIEGSSLNVVKIIRLLKKSKVKVM